MPDEKCARVMAVLEELFPDPPVPLNYRDAFTLLCAVMLSAQTTDGKVSAVRSVNMAVEGEGCWLFRQIDPLHG